MTMFDTLLVITGGCLITYWATLYDNPKRNDHAGMMGLLGITLVAGGLGHYFSY